MCDAPRPSRVTPSVVAIEDAAAICSLLLVASRRAAFRVFPLRTKLGEMHVFRFVSNLKPVFLPGVLIDLNDAGIESVVSIFLASRDPIF
jgi:hypothetical protein